MHFTNPQLLRMLAQRCTNKDVFMSSSRNISFTHIPKSGGTTVKRIMRDYLPDRYILEFHDPFQVAAKRHPNNLFVTIFREPVERAISLFSYINQRNKLSGNVAKNDMWVRSFRSDPKNWSTDGKVLKALREGVVQYFHPQLYYSARKEAYHLEASLLPRSALSVGKSSFLQYTKHMPYHTRCTRQMEAAWMLLRSYAVVGTIERFPRFLSMLQKRTGIRDEHFLRNASAVYKNPSSYGKVGAANITILYNNLRGKFYCDTVLWKLADTINEQDLLC